MNVSILIRICRLIKHLSSVLINFHPWKIFPSYLWFNNLVNFLYQENIPKLIYFHFHFANIIIRIDSFFTQILYLDFSKYFSFYFCLVGTSAAVGCFVLICWLSYLTSLIGEESIWYKVFKVLVVNHRS